MTTGNNINDKKIQEKISSNNNKNYKQSEEYLTNFKGEVQSIIKENLNNFVSILEDPASASQIVEDVSKATKKCLLGYKDLAEIGGAISGIIQGNPDYAETIVDGFTQGYISEKKDLTGIDNAISKIVNGNQKSASYIVGGFTRGCILAKSDSTSIGNAIYKIINTDGIKGNLGLLCNIVYGFTQGYISEKNDLTGIDNAISEIIKKDGIKENLDLVSNIIYGFTQGCISQENNLKDENIGNAIHNIIETDGIKGDSKLVYNIVYDFVQGYLSNKPDNIKDIAEIFSNSLNEMEKETKDTLKPIFSLIVSQYFMNTLTNSSNEQLEGNNKEETETQLFNCYKKLFHVKNEQGFQDIQLEKLSGLQDEYLKDKFKEKGVNGGAEYETFLKMACNLILKSKENKESTVENLENEDKPTVANLEEQKDIFKDLKFIRLDNNDNIKSKEKLFGEIGLESTDFGTKRGSEDSDFSIVHCSYLGHAFVMIIDKTQEWEEAKKSETKSIYLIDSSGYIENEKTKEDTPLNVKKQIFENTRTLNNDSYQENGTCWLNTMSAIGFLLEKQQECIAEQKQKQQKQVEQTEQQEQQPRESYGLSIDDISRDFGKGPNSSFVKGICDYSTKHFYTLTDISEEEKNIIKDLLREKIEQNTADQEKLSTASNRLGKSTEGQNKTSEEKISRLKDENLIIKYDYLIESIKRFKQNEKN